MKIVGNSAHNWAQHIYANFDIDTDILQILIITETYKYTYIMKNGSLCLP